jgi:hypothetical protein
MIHGRISIKKLIKCSNQISKPQFKFGVKIQHTANRRLFLKIETLVKEDDKKPSILEMWAKMPNVHLGEGKLWLPEPMELHGEGPTASEMILEDRK